MILGPHFFLRSVITITAVITLVFSASQAAYESPNFEKAPFDEDALSLTDNERDEIVAALAALALNFPEKTQVDDDLCEKALAIALLLKPLDGAARKAHDALLRGGKTEPVDFFSSLSSISKALWSHGEKLAAHDAEPDDRRLAPFLMEIALVLKSGPEPQEIWLFGHAAQFKSVNWGTLVTLQGSAFDSNLQAQLLMREAKDLGASSSTNPQPGPRPGPRPPRPPNGSKGKGKGKGTGNEVAEVKQAQTAIRFAAQDSDLGAIPGELKLDIRKPNPDEKSLFGLFLGSDGADKESFVMRLVWDREGPTIAGYEAAGELVKAEYPNWPKNLVAEYTFKAAGANQPSLVESTLPCALLLESAFSGAPIPPDLAITGTLSEEGAIILPGPASGLARAAGIGGGAVVKVLLMPSVGETGLTDAVTGGDLSVLVRPQVIGFSSYDEAKALSLGPRPEKLSEAIQKFEEIQNLTSQGMSLDEICKNPAVHERLQAIGALWPGHLSAKIMLAYGTQPIDMRLGQQGSVGQIDNALKPVAKYYTDSVFGGGGSVVGAAEKLVATARTALRELRPKVHEDARACLNSAERAIEGFDEYFSLTNKSSSRATQLRRELQETINELNAARTQLGATENISL